MKIAINNKVVGKISPSPSERQAAWRVVNGGFTNVEFSPAHLIRFIREGFAYTAQHTRWRASENFVAGQHVGLDFDGADFDAILQDDFIYRHASFLHTTASHTYSNPRSRVVFVLDRPLTKRRHGDKYALVTAAFASHWGDADKSCKDPVRLFFGAPGCDIHYLGNTLSLYDAATIVRPYKEQLRERAILPAREYNGDQSGFAEAILSRLVAEISVAPDGQKYATLIRASFTAGGWVGGGVLTEIEAFSALYTAICNRNCLDYDHARQGIEGGISRGMASPLHPDEQLDPLTESLFHKREAYA